MVWDHDEFRPGWDYERGGLRLVDAMRSTPGLESVPVVFWTVYSADQVDVAKLPPISIVVSKAHDPTHLVRVIRSLIIATGKTPKMKEKCS